MLSYKPDKEGHSCPVNRDDEPCWGPVEEVDHIYCVETDDYEPIYACCGHKNYLSLLNSAYIPEKK